MIRSRPGAGLAGEEREGVLEELLVDAGREIPEALAGGRRDEGGDVEPLEAVVAAGDRALAARRPDPAQDRLQPDAVLVGGEGLDHRAGMALRLLGDGLGEVFLNAACSSGVAARACCGRGRWIVQPIALQRLPAALLGDAVEPELGRHERRHLLRGPDPAVVGRRLQPLPQHAEHLRRQHRRAPRRCPAAGRRGSTARRRCSAPAAARPSAARSSSAAPPPRSSVPAPAARSPGSAAPASHPRCPDIPPATPRR